MVDINARDMTIREINTRVKELVNAGKRYGLSIPRRGTTWLSGC